MPHFSNWDAALATSAQPAYNTSVNRIALSKKVISAKPTPDTFAIGCNHVDDVLPVPKPGRHNEQAFAGGIFRMGRPKIMAVGMNGEDSYGELVCCRFVYSDSPQAPIPIMRS